MDGRAWDESLRRTSPETGLTVVTPAIIFIRRAGVTQLARVTAFQAVGRGFESRLPLHDPVAKFRGKQKMCLKGAAFLPIEPGGAVYLVEKRRVRAENQKKPLDKISWVRKFMVYFGHVSVFLWAAMRLNRDAHVAQLVEHILGKDEVTSSILVVGSECV